MARIYNKSSYLRRKELWFAFLFFACLLLIVAVSKTLGNKVQGNLESVSIWYLAVIVLIFLGYPLAKIFIRKSDLYSHGIWGEQVVGRELKRLSDEFTVFHGLRVPGVGDIDYVVVGPTGIFAVEVKSHRGNFDANPLVPRFARQTKYEAQQLRKFIESRFGQSLWIEGVLVLSRGRLNRGPQTFEGVHVMEKRDLVSFLETLSPKQGDYYKIGQKLIQFFV